MGKLPRNDATAFLVQHPHRFQVVWIHDGSIGRQVLFIGGGPAGKTHRVAGADTEDRVYRGVEIPHTMLSGTAEISW